MEGLTLEELMGHTLYVQVNYDQDILLIGKLEAIDAQGNLLLNNVQEQSKPQQQAHEDMTKPHQRMLGLVSVPRDSIVSVKIDPNDLKICRQAKQRLLSRVI